MNFAKLFHKSNSSIHQLQGNVLECTIEQIRGNKVIVDTGMRASFVCFRDELSESSTMIVIAGPFTARKLSSAPSSPVGQRRRDSASPDSSPRRGEDRSGSRWSRSRRSPLLHPGDQREEGASAEAVSRGEPSPFARLRLPNSQLGPTPSGRRSDQSPQETWRESSRRRRSGGDLGVAAAQPEVQCYRASKRGRLIKKSGAALFHAGFNDAGRVWSFIPFLASKQKATTHPLEVWRLERREAPAIYGSSHGFLASTRALLTSDSLPAGAGGDQEKSDRRSLLRTSGGEATESPEKRPPAPEREARSGPALGASRAFPGAGGPEKRRDERLFTIPASIISGPKPPFGDFKSGKKSQFVSAASVGVISSMEPPLLSVAGGELLSSPPEGRPDVRSAPSHPNDTSKIFAQQTSSPAAVALDSFLETTSVNTVDPLPAPKVAQRLRTRLPPLGLRRAGSGTAKAQLRSPAGSGGLTCVIGVEEKRSPLTGEFTCSAPKSMEKVSKRKLVWTELSKLWRTNVRMKGFILNSVNGGYAVAIAGYIAFLPKSLCINKKVFIGQWRQFAIIGMNPKIANIVVKEIRTGRTFLSKARAQRTRRKDRRNSSLHLRGPTKAPEGRL